ncbi:MAG: Smr/MutS family protein, partial [Candidatus Glassbacteria bacterium]|nr:Smr/MutS family protein [Candidatus Glassbacteria bacterium]
SFGKLLAAAASVRKYVLRREDSLPGLSRLASKLTEFEELERRITRTFDENSQVKSNASPVLGKLRRDARLVRERIEERLEQIAGRLAREGSKGENFFTLRQERYVLAIRRDEMHSCQGIIQGESGSGTTLFIEPEELVSQNNRLCEIELDIRREIIRILAEFSGELAENRPALEENIRVLAELDSLYARACYADRFGCCRPQTGRGRQLVLKKARHPLLLVRLTRHSGGSVREELVPLDFELAAHERTLLVSGPNAGGKTVLLKTVGLTVLMAQSGIFPPVGEGTSLPLFESIFAAIGDEQSIDKDLSTFSAHVGDLRAATEGGTPESLVLLDEIGVGTDPAEGAALAAAVLEHLTLRGCLTLGTTHFGELKILPEHIPGLVNGSLEFDTEKMRPTFLFRKGLPGQSYGLVIARNMGMDEEILDRAREYMSGETVNINEYLARLEQEHKKLGEQLAAARSERSSLAGQARALEEERRDLAERLEELELREKDFAREMDERRRRLLLEARREVEEVIGELKAQHAVERSGQAEKQARKALEDRIRELDHGRRAAGPEPDQSVSAGATPRKGDRVRVPALSLEGEVVEGPDSGGKFTVLAGRARLSLGAEELVLLGSGKRKRGAGGTEYAAWTADDEPAASDRLDLRGMRSDEVALELDRFLDAAVMAGLTGVVVVHGKGTGALRARVSELLSGDRRVASFRIGAWNEGGTGATVVSLR